MSQSLSAPTKVTHTEYSPLEETLPETIETSVISFKPLYDATISEVQTLHEHNVITNTLAESDTDDYTSSTYKSIKQNAYSVWGSHNVYIVSDIDTGEVVGLVSCTFDIVISQSQISVWMIHQDAERMYSRFIFTQLAETIFSETTISTVNGLAKLTQTELIHSLQASIIGSVGSFQRITETHTQTHTHSTLSEQMITEVAVYSISKQQYRQYKSQAPDADRNTPTKLSSSKQIAD